MRVLFLQGPGAASTHLDGQTAAGLWRAAQLCGHCLSYRASPSLGALVDSLRGRTCETSDLVLLNPGELDLAPDGALRSLRDALDHLTVPYVEIHERSGQLLDLDLRSSRQPLATIAISGDFGSGCRIAMSVAIRHLALIGRRDVSTDGATPDSMHR
ncbi:hypothetical protein QLQ15_05675 [Lysobacter sp. LF1]|uniref:3-dehydroquinate dehydratase n=1 Tax=Lysobacter stagni TaxID=3045172 RepID=A0ABT6XEU5_9GAMM|nr:hypothetical protein [Lysobacter sp. LF1]MDI9238400.1 hypothetical protein [Lysobacter sp. LF1]